jgi:hypothetical protein
MEAILPNSIVIQSYFARSNAPRNIEIFAPHYNSWRLQAELGTWPGNSTARRHLPDANRALLLLPLSTCGNFGRREVCSFIIWGIVISGLLNALDELVTTAVRQSAEHNGTRCRQSAAPGVSSTRLGVSDSSIVAQARLCGS